MLSGSYSLWLWTAAWALPHAGVHKQGISNERLCKRYLFFLEQIVKARANPNRKDGPPKMLYLRELFASLPLVLSERLAEQVAIPAASLPVISFADQPELRASNTGGRGCSQGWGKVCAHEGAWRYGSWFVELGVAAAAREDGR